MIKSKSNSTSTSVVKKCTDCKNNIALIDDLKDVVSILQEKNLLQITLDENNLSSLQSQLKNSERE